MTLTLDHLVVAARSLAEGQAWCEARFGLRPEAGGQHLFMGTHNRVFSIASEAFPRAYLEIIAIDPMLAPPGRTRWFDLDDAALQRTLMHGPQLVAWVARCDDIAAAPAAPDIAAALAAPDIAAALAALRAGGIDCGELLQAERATPGGVLRWQISVRTDGRRLLAGAAPVLIEWGDGHPTDAMGAAGVALLTLRLSGWPKALAALLPDTIVGDEAAGAPSLVAVLSGPCGAVTLQSPA